MNVSDIMTTQVKSCSIDMTLDQVAMMMWENDCGSIPVVNGNKPVGIVTDRDIAMCCALNHKAPWELTVPVITADRAIYTCSADDDIVTALAIMRDKKIHRIPVVDADGYLAGMLSIDDVIAHAEKGGLRKALGYDLAMSTLKAVAVHH